MTDTYVYDAFGAVTSSTGSTSNDWLFTGEQNDGETDLYFLRARYYDPETGRFLGRDPIEFAQRYAYAGNNPVAYTDPSGLEGEPSFGPTPGTADFTDEQMLYYYGRTNYYGLPKRPRTPRGRSPIDSNWVQPELLPNGCEVGDQVCGNSSPGSGGQVSFGCASGFADDCYSAAHLAANQPQYRHATPAIGPLGEVIGDGAGEIVGFATTRSFECYLGVSGVAAGTVVFAASFFTVGASAPVGVRIATGSAAYAAEACAFPAGGTPR